MSLLIKLFFLFFGLSAFSQDFKCDLFKLNKFNQYELFRTKVDGYDLGESGPDKGMYLCNLTYKGDLSNKYLYVGEVGDSSRLEIFQNDKLLSLLNHGFSFTLNSNYTRTIPLFINLGNIVFEKNYENISIKIFYENLIPVQKGLRSGIPQVLDFKSLLLRYTRDSGSIIFFTFEIVVFLILLIALFVDPRFVFFDKLFRSLILIESIICLVLLTGIARNYLPYAYVAKITLGFQLLLHGTFIFYVCSSFYFLNRISWIKQVINLSYLTFFILYLIINDSIGCFSLMSLFFTIIIPIFLTSNLGKDVIYSKGTEIPPIFSGSLILIAIIFCFDLFNLWFLRSKYYSLNHYFGFFIFNLVTYHLAFSRYQSGVYFKSRLSQLLMGKLEKPKIKNIDDIQEILGEFTKEVATLSKANGIKIYSQENEKEEILEFSYLKDLSYKQNILQKQSASYQLDLLGSRKILLYNFNSYDVPDYLSSSHDFFEHTYNLFLSFLDAQNKLLQKNELLSMMRGRVHPHQTLSEEYFLENFEFSAVLKTHALIRGDLVGSTSLNEVYGAKTIEEIIDIYFLELFEKYKEKGIIINRLNGDEVYFIFPALSSDTLSEDCIERCYSFLQDIVGHEEALALISKKQGVLMPLRYRFVMNTADNLKSDVALKSMNQVADGELDAMKRVLDYVAGEGECVVMENAFNQIKEKSLLIELPSQRLRGKLKNIRLFALDKK